eukprot:2018969-Rhodomonas_salina.1
MDAMDSEHAKHVRQAPAFGTQVCASVSVRMSTFVVCCTCGLCSCTLESDPVDGRGRSGVRRRGRSVLRAEMRHGYERARASGMSMGRSCESGMGRAMERVPRWC